MGSQRRTKRAVRAKDIKVDKIINVRGCIWKSSTGSPQTCQTSGKSPIVTRSVKAKKNMTKTKNNKRPLIPDPAHDTIWSSESSVKVKKHKVV